MLKENEDIFKEYFVKVILLSDNKFVVLNLVVWLGGLFIYVLLGIKVDMLF